MTQLHKAHSSPGTSLPSRADMVDGVRSYFQSRDLLRRGICLLNAGCFDGAERSFGEALELNPNSADLGRYLAQALMAQSRRTEAAEELGSLAEADRGDVTSRIRQALLL